MSGRSPLDGLEGWAADARARDAAEGRARERWLRTQAEEEATLHGFLLSLAERSAEAAVQVAGGRTYTGTVATVGADFVALGGAGRAPTLIALAAVATVVPADPGPRPLAAPDPAADGGSGPPPGGAGLADVLARAVGDRPGVAVDMAGSRLTGDLVAAGRDVVAVRSAGRTVVVTLQSVSAVSLLDSG